MKSSDAPAAQALILSTLKLVKVDKMRSIYEGITPAEDGAVHSFQNPAGTECISGDSLVVTSAGLREIQDLHHTMKVWDGEEYHRPTKQVKYTSRAGFRIVTEYGFELKGSANHPVMTRNGWKSLEDLSTHDEVEVVFGHDSWGTVCDLPDWKPIKGAHRHIHPPTFITPELAELVGMWLADGSLYEGSSYEVSLCNSSSEVLDRWEELTLHLFGVECSRVRTEYRVDASRIASKEVVRFFQRTLGLEGTALFKHIPPLFFRTNKSTMRALLRGITLDSHLLKEKGTVAFGTQSVHLRHQLHLILSHMGILASRGQDKLVVARPYAAKFLNDIGFVQTKKARHLGELLNKRYPERPAFNGWVKVKKKTLWRGDVYDVAMPRRHEYVANGLRVHNTTRFSHGSTWLFDPGSYNLATLPKKSAMEDELFRVRDVIVPHPGRVLGAADYSQAEARWCAWMAQDPVRMDIYAKGIDHYKYFVALLKWDDESRWEEVTKAERNAIGKVGVLSGQYQVGWKTLMEGVNDDYDLHGIAIDAKTAKKMHAIWPEGFPRTVEWWREIEYQALEVGYTLNPLGRKRIYFSRKDREADRRAIVREAIADGPQSANAMALNLATRRIYERADPGVLRLLQNVHDEVLFDALPEDFEEAARIVREEMERPFVVEGRELVIPSEVNRTETNWSEMREVEA